MSKRKSPVAVKVIACLLLLGSLASLMLPWMKLAVDTTRGRRTPAELLQEYVGMDAAAVKNSLREELSTVGYSSEARALDSLLDLVLDGRFKLHELGTLCRDLGKLSAAFQRPEAESVLSTAGLAIWAAAGLLALLGLIALICQLTDHRGGILPYFLLGALITGLLLFLRAMGNDALARESDELLSEYGLSGLVSYLGIDVRIIKMGIGAYLSPFLALVALLLMGIKKKAPKRRPAPERPAPSPYPARGAEGSVGPRPAVRTSWTCPNCGRICGTDRSFCDLCGTERPRLPAVVFCPFCGKRFPRGTAFCTDCGARIPQTLPSSGAGEAVNRRPGEELY